MVQAGFKLRLNRVITAEFQSKKMTLANVRFVFAYTLLVVGPVLGIIGIIKIGSSSKVPTSIGGVWKLEFNTSHLAFPPCLESLPLAQNPLALISQSGRNVELSLENHPKLLASGTIEAEGNIMKLAMPLPNDMKGEKECSGNHELLLTATVDRSANPRVMTGVLSISDCSPCSSIGFSAAREAQPAEK